MWYPPDEPLATSNITAFVEWLRATGIRPVTNPDDVFAWWSEGSSAFDAAVLCFAGAGTDTTLADLARDWSGPRNALIRIGKDRMCWSRDAFTAGPPPDVLAAMAAISGSNLAALIASHVLAAEIRADDRLLWHGDIADVWPLGALALGASVILVETADVSVEEIAGSERATIVLAHRPDPTPLVQR